MFTGLIEEIGAVSAVRNSGEAFDLVISAKTTREDVKLGDSIAVNGVCLTVTAFDAETFTFGLAPETLKRTSLGDFQKGDPVNLERALLPSTRLGGHFVQGHVDGTGTINAFRAEQDALWVTIVADKALMRYVVTKGFIAIDGVSLTVVDCDADWFNVTLVNYTLGKIALPLKKPGDRVNLEVDILAKYAERFLAGHTAPPERGQFIRMPPPMKKGRH